MALKTILNFYTGELQLINSSSSSGGGDVFGPSSSTDNAITRYDGTTGKLIQNSKALLQDSGIIEAQGFLTTRQVTDLVQVKPGETWIAPEIELELTGTIEIELDGEIVIV